MPCNLGQALGKADCNANYGDPKMLGISTQNISYATYGAAQSIASVQALIEEDQSYIVTPNFTNFDPSGSEPVTETDGYGNDIDTRNIKGSDLFYLDSNPCDFSNYTTNLKKGTYYVEIYFSNKFKLLQKKSDGTLAPFKAQVNAIPVGVPGLENKVQQYKLKLNYKGVEQFENVQLVELVDELTDYQELMPIGWYSEWASTYATSDRDILVGLRCDRSNAAFMTETPTARIISSNVDTPAVIAGAPVNGVSALTITKASSPVPLVGPDYITFVLETKTVDVVDKTTDQITFKV